MNLAKLQRHWGLLGRADPLWADQTKLGDRWGPEEFFATRRQEVARLLADLDRVGVPVRGGRALDFGCGAATLSVTLAAAAAILGLLLVTNLDVLLTNPGVLARHHLTSRAAGLYAVEAVVAAALLAAGWVLERCRAPSPVLAP